MSKVFKCCFHVCADSFLSTPSCTNRNALSYIHSPTKIALFHNRAVPATNPLTSYWSSLVKRSPKIDFGMARDYSGGREAATLLGAAVARDPFGPGRKRSPPEESKQRSFYVSGVLSGEEAWYWCWEWCNALRKIIKFCLRFKTIFYLSKRRDVLLDTYIVHYFPFHTNQTARHRANNLLWYTILQDKNKILIQLDEWNGCKLYWVIRDCTLSVLWSYADSIQVQYLY